MDQITPSFSHPLILSMKLAHTKDEGLRGPSTITVTKTVGKKMMWRMPPVTSIVGRRRRAQILTINGPIMIAHMSKVPCHCFDT